MPKASEKLYRCTAAGDGWSCGRRFPAGAGGTIGEHPRCPPHYQAERRNPGEPLKPVLDRSEPLVVVKFYVTKHGRKALEKRAREAGLSVSALCAQLTAQ